MLKVMDNGAGREAVEQVFELDEIARVGARRMLMAALETEAADYVERHRDQRDAEGRALVVHNGRAQARKLTLGAGTVELEAPRVNDRRRDEKGQRERFTSRILPPYMRRSPKVAEVLPILYLRGLSTGDFRPALEGLLGTDAAGLSPANIARLTACWEQEYAAFRQRDLSGREYVYVWVDGVHFNIRLEDDRLCTLVRSARGPTARRARGRGRLPGKRRELDGAVARTRASRDDRARTGGGRRRAGLLGRSARGLARDSRAGLLVPQARQRARQVAQATPAPRQTRPARDDVRRVPRRVRVRKAALRGRISGQVSQGGRVAYRPVNDRPKLPPLDHLKLSPSRLIESGWGSARGS